MMKKKVTRSKIKGKKSKLVDLVLFLERAMNYKLFYLEIHAWSSISSNNIKYEYQPSNLTPWSVPQFKKNTGNIFHIS